MIFAVEIYANSPAEAEAKAMEVFKCRPLSVKPLLCDHQRRICELIAQGFSNREIAHELDLADRTVKGHLAAIYKKSGVRTRVQLALKIMSTIGRQVLYNDLEDKLTPKQAEIARLCASGMKNKEIALEMETTEQTVKNSLRDIYDRLGVWNRLEFVLYMSRETAA